MRVIAIVLLVAAAACGGNDTSASDAAPGDSGVDVDATPTLTIGGEVRCMTGAGLVLRNGTQLLPISGNGTFAFPQETSVGAAYDVQVQTDPSSPSQTCTVENGSGTFAGSPVTNIIVRCSGAPRQWLTYTRADTTTRILVVGLDDANCPGPAIDVTPPNIMNDGFYMSPTSDGRFIAMDLQEAPFPFPSASYVLDVSGPPFGQAVRADGPLSFGFYRLAPTGHALVTVIGQSSGSIRLHITRWGTSFVEAPELLHPDEVLQINSDDLMWSADGALVAYTVQEASPSGQAVMNTYAVDVSIGPPYTPHLLGQSCGDIAFAANARRLVCSANMIDGEGEIRVYDLTNVATPTTMVVTPPGVLAGHGGLTPDGRQVLYLARTSSFRTEAFRVDISGQTPGSPQRIHPALADGFHVREFEITPDSRKAVLRGELEVSGEVDIYGVDISGASPGPLTRLSANPIAGAVDPSRGRMLFTQDSRYVYFTVSLNQSVTFFQRAALEPMSVASIVSVPSGVSPGEPIAFIGTDETRVLLLSTSNAHSQLLVVDTSGATPPLTIAVPDRNIAAYPLYPILTSTRDGVVFITENPTGNFLFDLYVMDFAAGLGPQEVSGFGAAGGVVMAATTTPVH